MIICKIPNYCVSEIQYTIRYVLGKLFDIKVIQFEELSDCNNIFLVNKNSSISIACDFFQSVSYNWLKKIHYLENINFTHYSNSNFEKELPVIFGEATIDIQPQTINCDIDIFGAIFFFLSRYEEAIDDVKLDSHQRFPATSSIAYKLGILDRPIVDEYIEFLGTLMQKLWPDLKRSPQISSQFVTCDVDWPFDSLSGSIKLTLKGIVSDIIHRQPFNLLLRKVSNYIYRKIRLYNKDYTRKMISWIMDENEKIGNKVAFYFIVKKTHQLDSDFDFNSKPMRQLLKEVHERGHEIGLHLGYDCFDNSELFKQSADRFKKILENENIKQDSFGGRMHYLRWDSKITPLLLEQNGFNYDSSLSFADKSGFRCGTCHSFPMYDLINRKPLKVIQRPLINMECTILSDKYEGVDNIDLALEKFHTFKNIVRDNNGEYVLLWHNTTLKTHKEKSLYKKIIN